MGRWMSPDWASGPVPYADLTNPQSLNLYGYVSNNPVTGIDPDGHVRAEMSGWGNYMERPGSGLEGWIGSLAAAAWDPLNPEEFGQKPKKNGSENPCSTQTCFVVAFSEKRFAPKRQGEMATREIWYRVETANGERVFNIEIRMF